MNGVSNQGSVLVLAPSGRDSELLCSTLHEHGITAQECRTLDELCQSISSDTLVVIIAVEAFREDQAELLRCLAAQAPWSDLPILVLTTYPSRIASATSNWNLASLIGLGNVTLMERPFHPLVLVSLVQSAIRARIRQYEVRDLLAREKSARQMAEASNRVKNEFLATVSHELRTPLNSILGWAGIMSNKEALDAETSKAVQVIIRNGQAQLRLIEDLLDISRINAGKMGLNIRLVDMSVVIQHSMDIIRPAIESKRMTLESALDKRIVVSGDPDRLQQVVWNLLSNAVKFTPEGGKVAVTAKRVQGRVELSVKDSGQGIPADFLPYLFEPFTQADATATRKHYGLGLGLAIVRQLVELHGGSVGASSEGLGHGSTFVIMIPAAPTDHLEEGLPHIYSESNLPR